MRVLRWAELGLGTVHEVSLIDIMWCWKAIRHHCLDLTGGNIISGLGKRGLLP